MAPVRFIFIAGLVGFCVSAFADTNYTIECGPKGTLQSFKSDAKRSDCSIYEDLGMKCGDSRSQAEAPNQIALRSVMDTYYSSRDSKSYDREVVTKILRDSVCSGGDPYFNLGMILIESPPFNKINTMYLQTYGVPPLDSVAGAAAVGCSVVSEKVKKTKFFSIDEWQSLMAVDKYTVNMKRTKVRDVKKGEVITLNNSRDGSSQTMTATEDGVLGQEVVRVRIPKGNPEARQTFYLAGSTEGAGTVYLAEPKDVYVREPAGFVINAGDGACKTQCCARIVAPANMNGKSLEEAFEHQLGQRFIADKFSQATRYPHVKNISDPFERFANLAQGYNGYGQLGKSEKVANKCLSGMDMKQTPIYGAGVSEMMLNSLMANSEIREIVSSARQQCGIQAEKSYLCETLGRGTFKINAQKFAGLQKRYLSNRDCPNHTYGYKERAVSQKPAPAKGVGSP